MSKAQESSTQVKSHELEEHRASLFKFAMLHLRNEAQAEDVVQETLLAAMQGAEKFAGNSSVRTWLTGILKHKILDQIRKSSRERAAEIHYDEDSSEDFDALFNERGAYAAVPAEWGSPDTALSQKNFFEVLERCMQGLPANTARVFAMREIMGLDTVEICKETGISATNCGVLLYRARMALRLCLDQRWFGRNR
ncbi:MAG: sigma-70 family RNA polymerase sigma factor [Betaproteobacteria bacterium]|nr:sigma-70 family RNA polymerase sigma factor [Betaproteobacteria bacterium]MBI2960728.1 sigma-70 family RNA polymerase sigma factor [Betaproteobacteria bacterium]